IIKMASNRLYCLCSQPYDPSKFMIQCDICKEWFHGSCVNLSEHQSLDIEKYHCPQCASVYGASIRKLRTNWHRHDHTDPDPHGKAVQTGTYMFIRELKSRHFPSFDESLLRLYGHQLTLSYVIENGFDKPIFVENKDGLDLKVPPATFTVNDIIEYLGDNYEIDVIDVNKQSNLKMTMGEWMSYLSIPVRDNVYNVISLEFSNTRMSPVVEPPNIVKHISWVNTFWPQFLPPECPYSKPNVQKYCLMGVADSYTDFHIDFGGTSVWYHILKGEKVFYMVKPTPANLSLYERWMSSSNQSETFFGDQVDVCYRVVIQQGQTFFIPTGWIHAVLTTQDSLVFGGNFLHSLNIPLQLQVNELENRIKTVEKFKFPYFQTSNWYAAKHILENLKDFIDKKLPCPDYLLSGAKALCSTLKNWTQEKDFVKKLDLIPETVNYSRLLKDIAKEIRHIEKQNNGNKPKVEREKRKSKRNKPGNYVEESPLTPLKLSISKLEKQAVKLENKLKVSIKRQQGGETLTATGNPGDGSSSNTEKVSPLRLSLLPLSSKQEINVVNVKTESKSLISLKSRKDTSIFDFIDSDEADLTANLVVDEKPKKPNNKGRPKSSKPHKKQPASPSKEP
ncbi:PHF2 (predicted), partial [Pycnogonum litorale]